MIEINRKYIELRLGGAVLFKECLPLDAQQKLVLHLRELLVSNPLFRPTMPKTGQPLSVRMTNFGSLGWVSDRQGYRYQASHPETGHPWPQIPHPVLEIWQACLPEDTPLPDACLMNWYDASARMGLHQDRDEAELNWPVLSVSLGDTAIFRLGGRERRAKTTSLKLESGDVLILQGEDRLAFHGVDRIIPGTSTLLDAPGRINLTLRVAGPVQSV